MAYDRVYLKCRVCGKEFYLAKTLGPGDGWFRPGPIEPEKFEAFLAEHDHCIPDLEQAVSAELWWQIFTVSHESDAWPAIDAATEAAHKSKLG